MLSQAVQLPVVVAKCVTSAIDFSFPCILHKAAAVLFLKKVSILGLSKRKKTMSH